MCAASLANVAHAADDKAAPLTWNGITLYGAVDIGVAYQNHGVPVSQDMYTGVAYLVTKNSRDSITAIAPNGMSQSKLGLKGDIPLAEDLSGVFN
ncbi:porin, partial [Lysobacter sp. 2RAB21]